MEDTKDLDGSGVTDAEPANNTGAGGDTLTVAEPLADASPVTREAETRAQATNRWILDGRRAEVDAFREQVRLACVDSGMTKRQAMDEAYRQAMAKFPRPGEEAGVEQPASDFTEQAPPAATGKVRGLSDLPASWPKLTANAALAAEVGWVQANRLTVVEELTGGATVVHLVRAHEPAPSMAALGWLETSIRSYAKYVDVVARVMASAVDDEQVERRERMGIDEIRGILSEMHEDSAGKRSSTSPR